MTLIQNNFGLKINAQYVADKFAKEYFSASNELINEVVATAKFEETSKNGMTLIKMYAKNELVKAWFKGGMYKELTEVETMKGINSVKEGVSRLETILNK